MNARPFPRALLALAFAASCALAPAAFARAADAPAPAPEKPDKPYGEWKKLTRDAEVKKGFFTLYHKRENLYL